MSALDKAFIKAYTKDPSPPAAGREDYPAGLARGPYVDWYETVPAGSVDGPYGGELVYRIDDAHATPQGLRPAHCRTSRRPASRRLHFRSRACR